VEKEKEKEHVFAETHKCLISLKTGGYWEQWRCVHSRGWVQNVWNMHAAQRSRNFHLYGSVRPTYVWFLPHISHLGKIPTNMFNSNQQLEIPLEFRGF